MRGRLATIWLFIPLHYAFNCLCPLHTRLSFSFKFNLLEQTGSDSHCRHRRRLPVSASPEILLKLL